MGPGLAHSAGGRRVRMAGCPLSDHPGILCGLPGRPRRHGGSTAQPPRFTWVRQNHAQSTSKFHKKKPTPGSVLAAWIVKVTGDAPPFNLGGRAHVQPPAKSLAGPEFIPPVRAGVLLGGGEQCIHDRREFTADQWTELGTDLIRAVTVDFRVCLTWVPPVPVGVSWYRKVSTKSPRTV